MEMNAIPEGFKMTELGPLPEEWDVVEVENIGEIITGRTPSTKKAEYYGSSHMFISPADIHEGRYVTKTNKWLSEKGLKVSRPLPRDTILVVCIGATIGKTAMTFVDNCTTNQQINAIISKGNVDSSYLYYSLNFHSPRLYPLAGGIGIPIINKSNFGNFKIPLPPPPEQRAIANVLSTAQDAKEKTDAVISATKGLKKSLMKHLFTYGQVSLEEAENVPLNETEIGLVPEEWDVVRVGDVFEFSKKPKNFKIDEDNEIPFIPMEYIPDEGLNNYKFNLKKSETIRSGSFFFKGDLLVAKITPSFENGKQCIVEDLPIDFGYATTEVWPIHETERTSILYLFYYLKQHEIRADIAGKMEGSTGRQRVPKNVLENFKIPLPSLTLQQKIASILSAVDEKIEKEETKKKALEELFKSLLNNLMTGKIRVNHLEV